MRVDGEEMWTLLRALDDPRHLERPVGYDHSATRQRFETLVSHLNDAFSCRCEVDAQVEDASLHGRLAVPAAGTATGDELVVCVSNFGNLATVAVTSPGVWTQEEFCTRLAAADDERLQQILDSLGYVVVPEEPLWSVYDGPSSITVDPAHPATWWTRFFDYL